MSETRVNIYTPTGAHVGYFLNPVVKQFPEGEYELKGEFFDSQNQRVVKLDVNPEVLPYVADLKEITDVDADRIGRVYVQRGRQPVSMTGAVIA
ncbi:MAG: hypothetical protein K8F91_23020 [Candidatus Obscuribacterales bacterium]|nr:hypothetical protein [Candidatus Obscuribacterales bacterium]